jgi:hypothetical protein
MKENVTRDKLRGLTIVRSFQLVKKLVDFYPPKYVEVVNPEDGTTSLELDGFEETPVRVEVRQPTVAERNKLVAACKDEKGVLNEMEFIIQAALRFTHDPESGERLYGLEDYDCLASQPSGGFVDQFGEEAIKLLTLGKPQTGSRNSAATRS